MSAATPSVHTPTGDRIERSTTYSTIDGDAFGPKFVSRATM